MSSLLFLLDLAAFVLVIAWTYANDSGTGAGEKGALGMKTPADRAAAGPLKPRWRQAPSKDAEAGSSGGAVRGFAGPARWSRGSPPKRP
jgi:hypothetical protein